MPSHAGGQHQILYEQKTKLMLLMKQALRNFLVDEWQIDWQWMIFKDSKEYCDKSWLLIADHIVVLDYGANSWSGYGVAINQVFLHSLLIQITAQHWYGLWMSVGWKCNLFLIVRSRFQIFFFKIHNGSRSMEIRIFEYQVGFGFGFFK